jgi:hypothetical protein
VLLFQPTTAEMHRRAGTWFDDEEIYGWFAQNLHRVREPSLCHSVRAKELKAAGMDWTAVLVAGDKNPRERIAAEVLASPAYASTAARVAAFVQKGGGCRATFFNYGRRLQGGGTAM